MSRFALGHWLGTRLMIIGSVLLVAGCASVSDAVNPVEWYKDIKGVVTGDESAESRSDGNPENRLATDRNKPAPGADEPIPSLSTVPLRPNITSRAERRRKRVAQCVASVVTQLQPVKIQLPVQMRLQQRHGADNGAA